MIVFALSLHRMISLLTEPSPATRKGNTLMFGMLDFTVHCTLGINECCDEQMDTESIEFQVYFAPFKLLNPVFSELS